MAANDARYIAFFDENEPLCAIIDGNRFAIYEALGFAGCREKCIGGFTPLIAAYGASYESKFEQ